MADEATQDAAALLTAGLVAEAAQRGIAVGEDAAEYVEQHLDAPSGAPAAVAEAPAQQETAPPAESEEGEGETIVSLPDWRPVPDDELEDLEDDEAGIPVAAAREALGEQTPPEYDDEYVYGDDPNADSLRAQLAAQAKRIEWLESLRAKENATQWRRDAERRYPLATFDAITATSKRGYLREAARSHNQNFRVLEPHLKRLAEAQASLKEAALAEARQEAQAAWGKPTVGPGTVPVDAAAEAAELDKARQTGDLTRVVHTMFNLGRGDQSA